MLDPVLAAVEGLDVSVLYANTVRPFDGPALRGVLSRPDAVVVEPYLAGTSTRLINEVLSDLPHRVLSLGVRRDELRRYGTPEQHIAATVSMRPDSGDPSRAFSACQRTPPEAAK